MRYLAIHSPLGDITGLVISLSDDAPSVAAVSEPNTLVTQVAMLDELIGQDELIDFHDLEDIGQFIERLRGFQVVGSQLVRRTSS